MQTTEAAFRRLTAGDAALIREIGHPDGLGDGVPRLDERTETLLRLAALVAFDAPQALFQIEVDAARRAGVDLEDAFAILVAVAGVVGSARIVSAAPRIALAAGYDAETALERNDPLDH